jgi:pimeloyl-ACP methyl ester carboxylesterase
VAIIQRPTVELHYTSIGTGSPVVLLHGWCDDGRTFEPLTDLLRGSYRCIAPDMRGHGRSQAPFDGCHSIEALSNDVAAICEREGVSRALVVGHSYGAIVAAATARRYPGLVGGLLLLDQVFDFVSGNAQLRAVEAMVRSPSQHLAFRKQMLSGLFGDVRGAPRERLEAAISATPVPVAMALWAPLFEWSPEELGRFGEELLTPLGALPATIIDRERHPEYHDRLARLYPLDAPRDVARGPLGAPRARRARCGRGPQALGGSSTSSSRVTSTTS